MNKKVHILLLALIFLIKVNAQVIKFSQPFVGSQNMSPATTGDGLYKQRIQSNLKTQFIDGNNLYNSIIVGWDKKIIKEEEENKSYIGIGGQIISDRLMGGIVQNNYISLALAYHVTFDKNLYNSLSLGMSGVFSQTTLDKSNLLFGDQYYTTGVPTGVGSQENLKSFPSGFAVNTGLMFSRHSEELFLRLGANFSFSANPQVTYSSYNKSDGSIKALFFNAETRVLYDYTLMIYGSASDQNSNQNVIYGGALSFPITSNWERIKRLYIGCSTRPGETIIPTFSLLLENYSFGISYDINNTSITGAQMKQNAFEISFSRSFGAKKPDRFRTLFD